MYENGMVRRSAGPIGDTPVFDALVREYRTNFRTVPGDPWAEPPVPRFSELTGTGFRFSLPSGPLGL
jgi:hypothetical protein